jgi:hypothetical protein
VDRAVGSKTHRDHCLNFENQAVSFPRFVSALYSRQNAKAALGKKQDYIAENDWHFRLQSANCGGWGQHDMVVRWSRSHAVPTYDPARIDAQVRAAAAAASVDMLGAGKSLPGDTKALPPQQSHGRQEPALLVPTSLHDGVAAVCDRLGISRSTCTAFFPEESAAGHASNASAMLARSYCPGGDGMPGRSFPVLQQALFLYYRDYQTLRFPYPHWLSLCFGDAQYRLV